MGALIRRPRQAESKRSPPWTGGRGGKVHSLPRGAAGKPAERFGGQVRQLQGGDEHRSERIRHTRSEERGSRRGRWRAWAPKIRPGFSAAPLWDRGRQRPGSAGGVLLATLALTLRLRRDGPG